MSDEHHDFRPQSPFNALPPMVIAIALVLGGIEILFQLGTLGLIGGQQAVGWRIAAMEDYGFFDTVFEAMRAQGVWPLEHVRRFFTYAFVHYSITHALMVIVFILALGKMVGETFGNFAVLVIFILSTLAGSLAYGLILTTNVQLLGAYPAAYGFIGAYTFILWLGLGAMQENQLRAFTLIGFLMGLQLVFGLLFGGSPDWVADLAGFAMGFVTAALMVPGAIGRIRARLQRR
ncbi:rhomboid family intramembrane serine protease [Celeribacter neptunius]|uniref:Rhomboid family protein n=1 Tax=Celeribacter neptunius TaxID=588602 RepID=A0A1I3QGM1_9RHOB|nr:rhomboid family intramembrane serine protease [Celeribacter neptunius]SFJ33264.1 Rhomboid family protein [Celeribacter neptunius]